MSASSAAATYTLTCDPAGGTAPQPATICAAIRAQPQLVRAAGGRSQACVGGAAYVFVKGAHAGRPVDATFSSCFSAQIAQRERWLGLLRYSTRKSVVCSLRTLRLIAARSDLNDLERRVVTTAIQAIPNLLRRGISCEGRPRGPAARPSSRHSATPPRPARPEPMLRLGSRGQAVRTLQRTLSRLSYLPADAVDGVFSTRTWHAVVAFQGWSGIGRDGVVGPKTRAALARGTRPAPWSTADGLEIHIDQQVLLFVHDGRVQRAIHVSTGAYGRTPLGHFAVASRDPMSWSYKFHVWMPLAQYFYDGYALHEFSDVPAYPASHGCVRVPADEAHTVWDFGRIGMRIWTTA